MQQSIDRKLLQQRIFFLFYLLGLELFSISVGRQNAFACPPWTQTPKPILKPFLENTSHRKAIDLACKSAPNVFKNAFSTECVLGDNYDKCMEAYRGLLIAGYKKISQTALKEAAELTGGFISTRLPSDGAKVLMMEGEATGKKNRMKAKSSSLLEGRVGTDPYASKTADPGRELCWKPNTPLPLPLVCDRIEERLKEERGFIESNLRDVRRFDKREIKRIGPFGVTQFLVMTEDRSHVEWIDSSDSEFEKKMTRQQFALASVVSSVSEGHQLLQLVSDADGVEFGAPVSADPTLRKNEERLFKDKDRGITTPAELKMLRSICSSFQRNNLHCPFEHGGEPRFGLAPIRNEELILAGWKRSTHTPPNFEVVTEEVIVPGVEQEEAMQESLVNYGRWRFRQHVYSVAREIIIPFELPCENSIDCSLNKMTLERASSLFLLKKPIALEDWNWIKTGVLLEQSHLEKQPPPSRQKVFDQLVLGEISGPWTKVATEATYTDGREGAEFFEVEHDGIADDLRNLDPGNRYLLSLFNKNLARRSSSLGSNLSILAGMDVTKLQEEEDGYSSSDE